MANPSTRNLEAALQWISLAEGAGDLQSHCDAVGRTARALREFLNDSRLWTRLKAPLGPRTGKAPPSAQTSNPHSPEGDPDWQVLQDLLGDKLAEVMIRVGYQPPPAAIDLVRYPRILAKEAEAGDLPQATREELASASRTWLIKLLNKLYLLSKRCDNDEAGTGPNEIEVRSLLEQAKPPLIGMTVATEFSTADEPELRTLQMYAVNASLDLTVRWLSCLEVEPPQAAG